MRTREHGQGLQSECQGIALVPTKGQQGAFFGFQWICGGLAMEVEGNATGELPVQKRIEIQFCPWKGRGAQIDHERLIFHGKPKSNRVGAQARFAPPKRRHQVRGPHGVDPHQFVASDFFHVVSTATTHPGVVDAHQSHAIFLRHPNELIRRFLQNDHAGMVASVNDLGHDGLVSHFDRGGFVFPLRIVDQLQELGQSRVFVAAQGSIYHMVGDHLGVVRSHRLAREHLQA